MKNLRDAILELRTEVNCRIEHGADSNGHLEYVQSQLDMLLKQPPEVGSVDECDSRWVWSAELPIKSGWYWFRAFKCGKLREQQKCIYVEMHPTLGGMMRDGRLPSDMEAWPGEWCGPIPEPVTPNEKVSDRR